MPVTIGGSPVSPSQAAELRTALGIPEPTTLTETKTILVGADQTVIFDSEDGGAAKLATLAAVSTYTGGSPSATAPAAFTAGQWTATAGNGQVVLNITALPSDGGSAITALQYRIGAGSAVNLTGTGTGERTITGLTNGVAVDIQIRAVNAIGAAAWSDTKTRTPVAGGGAGDMAFVQASDVVADGFGSDLTRTFGANVTVGNHVLAAFMVSDQSHTVSGTGATVDASPTISTTSRAWGLSIADVAAAATVFPFTLSSGWSHGGAAIEVSGSAPVFQGSVTAFETGATPDQRSLGITVNEDNSIVLLILNTSGAMTWTVGGGLTAINGAATDHYYLYAWGKFDAGSHNLLYQPSSNNSVVAAAAFIWNPAP